MRLRRTATALLLCASMCACESPPECAEGTVADGDVCVPEACGIGTWGDLPVDGDTVYVDGAADPGGDGSEDAPLASIQDGLDLAGSRGGGQVAVAAGSYSEALALDHGHAGVDLAGRCRELVTLDASDVTAHAAIQVAAEAGDEIVLSSLTVTGGAAGADDVTGDTTDAGGLVLTGGTVTAREVDLTR